MKAVTVRQPWASLIAAGVKTIETRPRRTSYRGRIAIHAGASLYNRHDTERFAEQLGGRWPILPLGAVVASAVLTDCVPVPGLMADGDVSETLWADDRDLPSESFHFTGLIWWLHEREHPFGDYSDRRWALLLDDIRPTTERCPWCWGDGGYGDVVLGTVQLCDVCDGAEFCNPIPARGCQAVPWEWTPTGDQP